MGGGRGDEGGVDDDDNDGWVDGWRQFQTKHTVVAAVGEVGGEEARPRLGR